MGFGKWLADRRSDANLTQSQLAERSGISANYVSALEREEPNARDGSPRRPRLEKVDRIAKALGVPVDDARLAAGYAPAVFSKPSNIQEFLAVLEKLGLPEMAPFEGVHDLTPERYEDMLHDIRTVIELNLRRGGRT